MRLDTLSVSMSLLHRAVMILLCRILGDFPCLRVVRSCMSVKVQVRFSVRITRLNGSGHLALTACHPDISRGADEGEQQAAESLRVQCHVRSRSLKESQRFEEDHVAFNAMSGLIVRVVQAVLKFNSLFLDNLHLVVRPIPNEAYH
mmetsp:Transcript_75646/g.133920  ORF Transcript_75646/g.133920 Transcript_75646/m.133920 type:complete len:146 (-) Transcript_75646:148-585(-)